MLLPRIREILDADTCAVLLLDEETNELVARAARRDRGGGGARRPHPARPGLRRPHRRRAAAGRPRRRRPRGRPEPDPAREGDQVDARRAAARPRRARSACSTSARSRRGVFTRDDVELLQLVARARRDRDRARAAARGGRRSSTSCRRTSSPIASHELRTPATSVYGALATLVERERPARRTMRDAADRRSRYEQGRAAARGCSSSCSTSRASTRGASRSSREPLVAAQPCSSEIVAQVARPTCRRCELEVAAGPRGRRRPARARPRRLEPARRTRRGTARRRSSSRARAARPAPADRRGGRGRRACRTSSRPRLFERFGRGSRRARAAGSGSRSRGRTRRAHGGDLVYEPGERRRALRADRAGSVAAARASTSAAALAYMTITSATTIAAITTPRTTSQRVRLRRMGLLMKCGHETTSLASASASFPCFYGLKAGSDCGRRYAPLLTGRAGLLPARRHGSGDRSGRRCR